MVRYIAFLRGINVGGKKLIKMEDLRRVFSSLGFKNVSTYIQSGNVVFTAGQKNPDLLGRKIKRKLLQALGHEVTVILRTTDELQGLVRSSPFKRIKPGTEIMLFVTFLAAEPNRKPKLPLMSKAENLDVVAIRNRTAFILARRRKNGWFGFPNNFVEKQLAVPATTRNWTTVKKIIDFAEAQSDSP